LKEPPVSGFHLPRSRTRISRYVPGARKSGLHRIALRVTRCKWHGDSRIGRLGKQPRQSQPEPVARNGFSLARNSCRLSTTSIPGSKLPTCYFATFQVGFRARSAIRLHYRVPDCAGCGGFIACGPLHCHHSVGLPRLRSPLPSGIFTSLGIKAFNRVCCLPVRLTSPPDFLSLPAARPD
jgi:hypothetical protein